ncbi:heavy metal sensor histidine kinase [uncultured Oceanisphaera sp.]|uniref:heavy metal sensor histidine kinase n=1 Tax=uncultured Oceanisphaera sp. TaxID=353858 RepID=UPI00263688DF|nr:heavy metal sensor histidine kinase [uncultured Oceanisphaera sp.]
MGSHLSLTTRLSLVFSISMLAIWSVVSLVLIQALDHHFARQDQTDIRGRIILAENFLSAHVQSNNRDWSVLQARLSDALSGHGGYYLQMTDLNGKTLVTVGPHSQTPSQTGLSRPLPAPEALPLAESWIENGIRYRSMTEQFVLNGLPSVSASTGLPDSVLIRVALDTSYHQHFIDDIKIGLAWLTGGIALVSVLLGWFASRMGLTPLHSLARLSARVTANRLDHRLPVAGAPAELHGPINAFNDMLDRLEDSFQRLTAFSSDIAHELRTPVNSLMMQTQVALAHPRHAEEYKEVLYANLETAERLARMIGEMLFLAKSEQGQLGMQPQPLALADELDELLEFFEPLASEQQVRLQRRGNGRLLGDKSMLQRAFSNLLTNAIRYTPAQGEVRISIGSNAEGTTVQVANPGPAIPPEQWPRLFDRFYRADSARQPVTEGTGLGLAIAKAIISAHGGSLSVQSDERETCFTAWFPTGPGAVTT